MLRGIKQEVVDKNSEQYLEYQMKLKQSIADKFKYKDYLQKCFSIIMGQCSPSVEQNVEADEIFYNIKEKSDSIVLIKLLEKVCYSYRAHECTPLGALDVLDITTGMHQPDDVHEVRHYESFKLIAEMCKANGINFAVICSANVNIAIKTLYEKNKISCKRTYEDGTYFKLSNENRKLVDKVAKEICLSTRFLSLASNKLHAAGKQALRNDMVKGEQQL